MSNVKIIAFYLPQFHPIPENDKWWGKGFTEWTNVKKAKPLWEGHYQPKVPLNDNYYSLLDSSTLEMQCDMAKKYGVYGFCYYHYWFGNGKKLLEKPAEIMLESKKIDLPFCFSWANENWSRNWDGGNREIMVKQDYGDRESWEIHLQYLLPFFKDDRYIKIDGNPVFIIYKPELIDSFDEMVAYWKNRIREFGFSDICIMSQYPNVFRHEEKKYNLDYKIKFEPMYSNCHYQDRNWFERKLTALKLGVKRKDGLTIRNYDKQWRYILEKEDRGGNIIPGAFVDWDNTARNVKGTAFIGATPEKFKKYMSQLIKQIVNGEYSTNLLFINAWNEWGEGCYLEPDEKNHYQYLEAIRDLMEGE